MAVIQTSRDINTKIDNLWYIISDVDKDPDYWYGTRSVKNTKKRRKPHRKRNHNLI
jgi:hypothetical protein